ncbi:MAG: type II toxin-antitoxin system HicA family toxin [Candidatus Diapherotrites archaeon]|nr:type II toxin-antitoxin system HicA family toxin [Candidatus Diapherotrites archaeon]
MLNVVKTDKLLRALHKLGFRALRQKGAHLFFQHPDGRTTLVPRHNEIRIKLVSKIAKDIQLDLERFLEQL